MTRVEAGGSAITPGRLHRLWPAKRLGTVEAERHGGPEMTVPMRRARDAFAGLA